MFMVQKNEVQKERLETMQMNIPFVKHIGIEKKDEKTLKLALKKEVENHIGTMHGAAQFALAETQSGLYLESVFPKYKGTFVPLLRSSSVKYKTPVTTEVYAIAHASKESLEKFEAQFLKKGRASISVFVELRDSDDVLTMVGEFGWYIQEI
jgi:acyl-coenzyme A thioesterase PaaI-like protein